MKKNLKMRLAVFLSILMVLPAVMVILPRAATEVSAASSYTFLDWRWGSTHSSIQVEKGQSFYIGDYATVCTSQGSGTRIGTLSMFKGSYSSSRKSVATADQKGLITAKKPGTSTITLKYDGEKLTIKLQVVASGSFKTPATFSKVKKQAASLAKKIPSKITTKNGFSLLKQLQAFETSMTSSVDFDPYGFLTENGSSSSAVTDKLAVPKAGRAFLLRAMLDDYAQKNNPTSTRSAKVMNLKSVSATTGKVTIKLKKKLDAAQILAARILYNTPENNDLSGTTTAYLELNLYDTKNYSSMYYGRALMKKGSSTLTVIPYQYTSSGFTKSKLQKGHTYYLEYTRKGWTKGKTVKVK